MADPRSIRVNCSTCQKAFKIPSRYAGKKVKCPGCQGPLSAPAAAKTAARGASAQRSPLPTLQPVDDDFEDYDDYDDYSEIDAYDDFGGAHADTALPRGLPPRLRREESQIQVERRRRAVTPFSETRLGAWLTNSRFVGGLGTMFVSGGIFAWGWMMGYIYTYMPFVFAAGLIAVCTSLFELFDE